MIGIKLVSYAAEIIFEGKNYDRAFKHYILAARAGYKQSLDNVKIGYMYGVITKDEYANTLRAYQSRQDEMKSKDRDKVAEAFRQGRGTNHYYG